MNKNAKWITSEEFSTLLPDEKIFHKEMNPYKPVYNEKLWNSHVLFRNKFNLTTTKNCKISISADDYYFLYINGQYVCSGPAPGYPWHYYYNEIDISVFIPHATGRLMPAFALSQKSTFAPVLAVIVGNKNNKVPFMAEKIHGISVKKQPCVMKRTDTLKLPGRTAVVGGVYLSASVADIKADENSSVFKFKHRRGVQKVLFGVFRPFYNGIIFS